MCCGCPPEKLRKRCNESNERKSRIYVQSWKVRIPRSSSLSFTDEYSHVGWLVNDRAAVPKHESTIPSLSEALIRTAQLNFTVRFSLKTTELVIEVPAHW